MKQSLCLRASVARHDEFVRLINLILNEKEETKMKTTSKTIKRARLILMAVLVLGFMLIY